MSLVEKTSATRQRLQARAIDLSIPALKSAIENPLEIQQRAQKKARE
jgi:hypothetical protein